MNKLKALPVYAIITASIILSGCLSFSYRPVGVEPAAFEMKNESYEILGDAEGYSSSFRLFWVLPVTPEISLDEAATDAIRAKGGDNLVRVSISRQRDVYIVGTVEEVCMTGKVIRYTANMTENKADKKESQK